MPAPTAVLLLRPHLGYPPQADCHDFHELIVVLRGRYLTTCDTGQLRVDPGGAVLYPVGVRHRGKRQNPQPSFFCIQWPAGTDLGDVPLVGTDPSQRLVMAASWLHDQFLRPERNLQAEAGLLGALVDEVCMQAGATGANKASCDEADDPVAAVHRVLRHNFSQHQALDDLAAIAGLGPKQLNRRFRHRYGCLPLEYLRRLRVQAACTMLTGGKESVEAIAHACGFNRGSYLARVLKADTGLTAREIRAGHAPTLRGL